MNEYMTERQKRIILIVIFIGFLLALIVALTDTGEAAPEWYFQATVQANCAADNQTAEVGWTFWNRDSRTMRVTVSLADGTQQVRDVLPGAIDSGTFSGRALPLAPGTVRFDMAWIGRSGTDSATRSYATVVCIPTAVALRAFSAEPARLCKAWSKVCTRYKYLWGVRYCHAWRFTCIRYVRAEPGRVAGLAAPLPGNRGGCNPESRVLGLACTVQDAGVGWVSGTCQWGEYFLAQTLRTFLPGEPVTVSGCVDQHGVLFSAPGAPLRISR